MEKMTAWEMLAKNELAEGTFRRYRNLIVEYRDKYGDSVDPEDLARYIADTKARMDVVRALRNYVRLLEKVGMARTGTLSFMPRPVPRISRLIRIPRPEHVERLLRHTPNLFVRIAFMLMVDAGLRHSEVLALTWSDVDLEAHTLRIRNKNYKRPRGRVIPILTDRLYAHLNQASRHPKASGEMPVFIVPRQRVRYRDRVLSQELKTCAERARKNGYWVPEDLQPHLLRHYFAVQCARLPGADIKAIQLVLGHANLNVTNAYLRKLGVDTGQIPKSWLWFETAVKLAIEEERQRGHT